MTKSLNERGLGRWTDRYQQIMITRCLECNVNVAGRHQHEREVHNFEDPESIKNESSSTR